VLDRNWFVITSSFFINNKERGNIRTMQEIRNTWAHITPNDISKARVIDDVNVIIALMQAFDASMKDTRDMENFIFDVEEDKDIHTAPAKEPVKEAAPVAESPASVGQPEGIAVGSIVVLVSDPSVIGAVIGVSGNKYSVLVNGKVQSYYKEQIQLQNAKEEHKYLSLPKVRSALTAYQIHNPGSSNLYSLKGPGEFYLSRMDRYGIQSLRRRGCPAAACRPCRQSDGYREHGDVPLLRQSRLYHWREYLH
jgi:hypothetical protein